MPDPCPFKGLCLLVLLCFASPSCFVTFRAEAKKSHLAAGNSSFSKREKSFPVRDGFLLPKREKFRSGKNPQPDVLCARATPCCLSVEPCCCDVLLSVVRKKIQQQE